MLVNTYAVNFDNMRNYKLSPFSAISPIGVVIKLICAPFFGLHLFVCLFINSDDNPLNDISELLAFPFRIIGWVFGIIFIPIQIITIPSVLIYLHFSKLDPEMYRLNQMKNNSEEIELLLSILKQIEETKKNDDISQKVSIPIEKPKIVHCTSCNTEIECYENQPIITCSKCGKKYKNPYFKEK